MKQLTESLVAEIFLDDIESCTFEVVDCDGDSGLLWHDDLQWGEVGLIERVADQIVSDYGYKSRAEFAIAFETMRYDQPTGCGEIYKEFTVRLNAVAVELQTVGEGLEIQDNTAWWRLCFSDQWTYEAFAAYFKASRAIYGQE